MKGNFNDRTVSCRAVNDNRINDLTKELMPIVLMIEVCQLSKTKYLQEEC